MSFSIGCPFHTTVLRRICHNLYNLVGIANSIPLKQGLVAVGEEVASDDIAVENMLVPSRTQIPQISTDDTPLNQTQPPATRNQPAVPSLASSAQSTSAMNCLVSEGSLLTRPDEDCETTPLVEHQVGSNVYRQRAILSNIQNTGQPQQPVQKLNGKFTSQLRNNISSEICVPVTTDSGHFLAASSIAQSQANVLQQNIAFVANQSSLLLDNLQPSEMNSNNNQLQNRAVHGNYYMQRVQAERGHVQCSIDHVQRNIDHVQTNVSHVQGDSVQVQTASDLVQSTMGHTQNDRGHVPDNGKHVQNDQDHVQSILGISNAPETNATSSENLNRERSHMQSHSTFVSSINESRTNVTSQTNSHVNRGKGHVPRISIFAPSNEESCGNINSQTNSHVMNIGKSHVPSISIFAPSTDESCGNVPLQTNYHVNNTSILQNEHVIHNDESSSINNRTENASLGQSPFNLIDFISNSSERTCGVLPTDANANQETRANIMATKSALDGQTALLENIMGFTERNPESLTLPLTPKGSSGSGYGLGLDVDDFLNSEDGQRM